MFRLLSSLVCHSGPTSGRTKRFAGRTSSHVDYGTLESRQLLAVTTLNLGGELRIVSDGAADEVQVSQINASTLRVSITGQANEDFSLASINSMRFLGGGGDDIFTSTVNINTIARGNNGNDTLTTAGGNDRVLGDDGEDTLTSTGGTNTINGGEGDDRLNGGTGVDTIFGYLGNDTIYGYAGDDVLVAGRGDDIVYAGSGDDLVYGFWGNDTIRGEGGDDTLYAQQDDDIVYGGVGNDIVRGHVGNDRLFGSEGNDRILGDEGDDYHSGGSGDDVIFGWTGNDELYGGDDTDLLVGGDGNDTLNGDNGNDFLRGNNGNDRMNGGSGRDRLAGDDGDDILNGDGDYDNVFGNAGNDTITATSADRVTGGSGDDKLTLSGQTFDRVLLSGNRADYAVTQAGNLLYVRDTEGDDGLDEVTGADFLQFANATITAAADVSQRVTIRPIIVSDNNGSNTAGFFGTDAQEAEIKRRIDEIYLQANIDIEWLAERSFNNSFVNEGNTSGTRPTGDLQLTTDAGDNAGVGNSNSLTIDMYFVEVAAGFSRRSENVANGLAFVGFNGISIHIGDSLPTFEAGRDVVAEVTAHEIAHNLGLDHVSDPNNLMGDGKNINASQRTTMLNNRYSVNI